MPCVWTQGNIFSLKGWPVTATGCPRRLWSLQPQIFSKVVCTWYWAACFRWLYKMMSKDPFQSEPFSDDKITCNQNIFSIPSGTMYLINVTCIFYKGLEKTQLPLIPLDHITTCINTEGALKCDLSRGRQSLQTSWEEDSKILVLCTPWHVSASLLIEQGQTGNLSYCNHLDISDIFFTSKKFETSFVDAFHIWVISQLPETWKYSFLKWEVSKSKDYINQEKCTSTIHTKHHTLARKQAAAVKLDPTDDDKGQW